MLVVAGVPVVAGAVGVAAAALFALLAIIVSALLVTIALAYQASDQTQVEQNALQEWEYASAKIDASAQSAITGVYQWNNAMVANDPQGAQAQQTQIAADTLTISTLLSEISTLQLPSDAADPMTTQRQSALAATSFAAGFMAAGEHTDADLQIKGAAALKAWRDASVSVEPFIESEVTDNLGIAAARTAYVYEVMIVGGVVFLIALLLLATEPSAQAEEKFQKLAGGQIRAKVAGMEISDQVHWREFYDRSGRITSMSMGRKRTGKWRVEKD